MEFIKDCLSRKMSLGDVAIKYNIDVEDVLPKYLKEKAKYTQSELNSIMEEVYYDFKGMY